MRYGNWEVDKERHRERVGRLRNNGGTSRPLYEHSTSPLIEAIRTETHRAHQTRGSRSRAHKELPNSRGEDHQRVGYDAETNRLNGVTLLFTEPSDASMPDVRWRLCAFQGGEVLNEPSLYIHRQTCYIFGRERKVAHIPTDHPSCSDQHAVIQYRLVEKEQPDGLLKKQVSPYIMDLGSTNGTFINGKRIEPQRYYELMEKDTIKFGNSSREYVMFQLINKVRHHHTNSDKVF
ncbi:hypothetical protein MKW94_000632 [Papaver nudicaule]|uniref:FHA domain-containing protein n=1 Tax=Papaver nudicaule TaxID=74823 RepID=A0AA41VWY4_PAPNU|nr:hypothetical protein [Papaver nudicaule]